ncbi:MAG TPA: hypothetical protein VIH87_11520 [Methylocella sp.]
MNPKPIAGLCSAAAIATFFLTTLGGCAVVDQYGSRAIEYNEQTQTSKSSTILLNILRSAYHEPLQFTDVSTVTGTASAQAGINAAIPFRIGGAKFTGPNILSLNPSASMSGGPQFSVANLNTQEFYRGIQSSVDSTIIFNYVDSGINLRVLLPLLISDIEIDNSHTNKKAVIHNSGSSESYRTFLEAMGDLIDHGLTVAKAVKPPDKTFGPRLTKEEVSDPKLLSALVQVIGAGGAGADGASFSLKDVTRKGHPPEFQLSKRGENSPHFCFVDKETPYGEATELSVSDLKAKGMPRSFFLTLVYANGKPLLGFPVHKNSCQLAETAVNIMLRVRSVEGIFTFLGEMARTELGLGSGGPDDLATPLTSKSDVPFYLFKIEQRLPLNGEISANFHGSTYTISADPSGPNASNQVVQLLTDLLALQSSAKNLPAPNVIAIVP